MTEPNPKKKYKEKRKYEFISNLFVLIFTKSINDNADN